MARSWWDPDVTGRLAGALDRAAGGAPTVLLVEGPPGAGKSTLLDELAGRAGGFAVERSEETFAPYGVLARWGVDVAGPGGGLPDTALAAQRLRGRIDDLAAVGRPVLLILDDLQWADPESVIVLVEVLARAAGDRLLLAVASRPLPPETHPAWQRWVTRPGRAVRVELRGLSRPQAGELIRTLRPDADPATVEALC